MKVSPSGSMQWEMVVPGTDGARGIEPAFDGGYLVAGMAPPRPNVPRDQRRIHILKFSEEIPEEVFLRGDPTGDSVIELRDAVRVLRYLFCSETAPWCLDSADANDDGVINLTDAISIIQAVLSSEAALPPPSDEPGSDPTPDSLDCQ